MTEDEIERITAAKAEVTAHLATVPLLAYNLAAVDPRLQEYVSEVCGHPADHNLYEQLSVSAFLRKVARYGINVTAVRRFFMFYEQLKFPGKTGKRCYELTPVQVYQFCNIFGFWEGGKRVTREVCLFVPRKFSKTTSTASLAIYDMLFGDANAEAYVGANSLDQAKKCFNVIRGCMHSLDPLGRRYTVNEQVIKSKRQDREAFAQCLTANARTKDGLNASTVILDEFSQAQDNELLTVLTTSMGVRDNPLTVIITTASDVFDGPFYEMLEGYKRDLLSSAPDDTLFAHLFMPDAGDDESDERTWSKVHPHLGVTVTEDFYRREYKKALRDGAGAMLAFRTKLLNIYAENQQRAWISATLARDMMLPMSLDALRGRPDAMVAIDLSESDDFSAVTAGIYNASAQTFSFHTAYFFPEGALTDHRNEKLYRTWAAAGHLTLTEGPVIDYGAIVKYILWLNDRVTILRIGYDPWKSQECINALAAAGAGNVITPVKQTYGAFTAPVESFEHGAKTHKIAINDNPINAYCFGNAILDSDRMENVKPIKRARNLKIDGVITTLMCMRLFLDYSR